MAAQARLLWSLLEAWCGGWGRRDPGQTLREVLVALPSSCSDTRGRGPASSGLPAWEPHSGVGGKVKETAPTHRLLS